jgi:hypothetical protein
MVGCPVIQHPPDSEPPAGRFATLLYTVGLIGTGVRAQSSFLAHSMSGFS